MTARRSANVSSASWPKSWSSTSTISRSATRRWRAWSSWTGRKAPSRTRRTRTNSSPWRSRTTRLSSACGAIRACGALWDQREWKQYVVMGYRGPLLWLRPLSRLLFPALGYPALPPVGDTLAFPTAAFLATDSEEPDLLRALLMALSHAAEKFPFFLAGSADEGPGAAVLRGFRGVRYRSLLYRVDPAGCDAEAGVGPCPHVELARL